MKNTNSENLTVEDAEEKTGTNVPEDNGLESVLSLQEKNNNQLKGFNELLDSLSSSEDKQKSLWRQIYENAITDRMNAYIVWIDLYRNVQNIPSEHAIHGPNLSKYMERMSKANDQLIKLAELVGNAKKKDTPEITEDSLYSQFEKT